MKNLEHLPTGELGELQKRLLTPEERRELDLRVEIITEMVKARSSGIESAGLETSSGVAQPVISRVERGTTDPRISTLLKLLASLGKPQGCPPGERNSRIEEFEP